MKKTIVRTMSESPTAGRRSKYSVELKRFLKFAFVGGVNTLVDYAAWALLFYVFQAPLAMSQAVGYGAGVVNSSVLNIKWTFRQATVWNSRRFLLFEFVTSFPSSLVYWQSQSSQEPCPHGRQRWGLSL
jgi:putative flippase GtrA